MMDRPLWTATREFHHACEEHPVGQRMVKGEVSLQEWADWLWAFAAIHDSVDMHLPDVMWRFTKFRKDFSQLNQSGVVANKSKAATEYSEQLLTATETEIMGAAYVLHGAHRRGGQVLKKLLSGLDLPCNHVEYDDPKQAEAFVKALSVREELTKGAVECFKVLLEVMDEIDGKSKIKESKES